MIFILLATTILLWCYKLNPLGSSDFPKKKRVLTHVRNFLGNTGFCLWNINVTLVPISTLMIIFNTNPFWVSIMGYFFNKEKIASFEFFGMVICFAGIIVIALSKPSVPDSNNTLRLLGIFLTFWLSW